MVSDQELVIRLCNKDEEAFRTLFLDYKEQVYNTVLNIVQNEEEAADLLQEVFVEVYQSISTFQGNSTLSTWIYRICVNKSLMSLRRRKRFLQFFRPTLPFSTHLEPSTWVHPGIVAENKESAKLLYRAIAQLPDKHRVSFTLFHINGLSQNQIAEITNQSLSAVETQIFRAKQKLAKVLDSLR